MGTSSSSTSTRQRFQLPVAFKSSTTRLSKPTQPYLHTLCQLIINFVSNGTKQPKSGGQFSTHPVYLSLSFATVVLANSPTFFSFSSSFSSTSSSSVSSMYKHKRFIRNKLVCVH